MTVARREAASDTFQKLVEIAREGDLKEIQIFIGQLFAAGKLDNLVVELVQDALLNCERSDNLEFAAMFRFLDESIARVQRNLGGTSRTQVSYTATASAPKAFTQSSHSVHPDPNDPEEQKELYKAGIRLTLLLKECDKDASKLKVVNLFQRTPDLYDTFSPPFCSFISRKAFPYHWFSCFIDY